MFGDPIRRTDEKKFSFPNIIGRMMSAAISGNCTSILAISCSDKQQNHIN